MDTEDVCDLMKAAAISNPVEQFCQMHSVTTEVAESYLEAAGRDIKFASQLYKESPPPSVTRLYEVNPTTLNQIDALTIQSVPSNSYQRKSWMVSNHGQQCWPLRCQVVSLGEGMDRICDVEIPSLPPNKIGIISITFIAPQSSGTYHFDLKIVTAGNRSFQGDSLQGTFEVDPNIDARLEVAERMQQAQLYE